MPRPPPCSRCTLLTSCPLPPTPHPARRPKEIKEIRDFLHIARRKDARQVKIMKTSKVTKFKVRCTKYLYTLAVKDSEKADKLKSSLPPGAWRARLARGRGGGGLCHTACLINPTLLLHVPRALPPHAGLARTELPKKN